jgi:RND family efflux transporter MFP subunit
MNYESGFSRDLSLAEAPGADEGARRRRVLVIAAVVALALVAVAAWYLMSGTAAEPKGGAAKGGREASAVTVIVPGRSTVDNVISATGNLAARRELPVGIAGEGGQVERVLVEPGQWVVAGQVLATIDRRVQAQQAASLGSSIAVSEADARLADSNLQRAQALVSRGFISKADIDRLTATRDSARARVNVARAQYQQSLASNSRLDIRAPAAGLVLERRVEPGQVVSAGSGVLFRLAKGGELELLAQMGESDLVAMRPGMRAQVTPVGSPTAFNGEIWQVAPIVDPQTRQGIARISLGYDQALRPGGFASAKIVSGAANVPLLPESAVMSDSKGSFVMVVGKDNKVERRDVKIGSVADAGVTIVEGLAGTEMIVKSAGAFLNPGETVKPTREVAAR